MRPAAPARWPASRAVPPPRQPAAGVARDPRTPATRPGSAASATPRIQTASAAARPIAPSARRSDPVRPRRSSSSISRTMARRSACSCGNGTGALLLDRAFLLALGNRLARRFARRCRTAGRARPRSRRRPRTPPTRDARPPAPGSASSGSATATTDSARCSSRRPALDVVGAHPHRRLGAAAATPPRAGAAFVFARRPATLLRARCATADSASGELDPLERRHRRVGVLGLQRHVQQFSLVCQHGPARADASARRAHGG